jgi:protocatechuate 3,4-dioxygenase beta subunit
MRRFPLAVLFCASFAVAQNTPSSPPTGAATAEPGLKIRVEGTILSLNGDTVRKATVRLQGTATQPGQPPTSYVETTDNGGKFAFDEVAPGRYTLSAEKPGFVTTRYGARSNTSPGTQLVLAAGMEMKDVAIKMTPQGVIAGKVLDQDGDPVVGAQIQAMRSVYSGARKQLQPNGAATTNDLGEYRLSNLAPGRYYIVASDRRQLLVGPQERPGRAGEVEVGSITTYYPNGTDASNAVLIDVAAGGEMRGIDIRLLKGKVYTVRGKAVSTSSLPSPAMVSFRRRDDNSGLPPVLTGGSTSQLRPDGTFEFRNILPGTYVLQFAPVNINGNSPANLTGRVEVTVNDANIDGLVLPLGPGPEIAGTLKLEDGDISALLRPAQNSSAVAVAGNAVFALPGRLGIILASPESGASTAQVKEDGTFRFNTVGTARYSLNVISLPPGTYLKSARYGGQDVTHALIDTTSGTGGTLDLVLSSKAADIAGSVQNDKGDALAGVIVTLWPKTPDASPSGGARPANTDQNGGFKFQGLAPGEYYVAAWEELEPGLAASPDFLSHFTSEASTVKLAEGGHETRDLKPVPSDKVAVEIAKLP